MPDIVPQKPSAHASIGAIALARATCPEARRLPVPLGVRSLAGSDDIAMVVQDGRPRIEQHAWYWSASQPIPFDEDGVLGVEYMYRDMHNYKTGGAIHIRGPFSREDMTLLLGALGAGDDDAFVPHQVGFGDLNTMDGPPEFDDADHVWHTLERLTWNAQGDHPVMEWSDLREAFRQRAIHGYDLMAAMRRMDPNGWW